MNDQWPSLNFQEWKDTYATLHMLTQIVGKIRLAQIALGQSFVAHDPVRYFTRSDDLAHSLRQSNVSN